MGLGRLAGVSPGRTARQQLPRPQLWTPGAAAPWADLAPDRRSLSARAVRRRLGDGVLEQAPAVPPAHEGAAAVLAVLEPDAQGGLEVVITRRGERMRTHRGELSLPGGAQDPGETLVRTTLREASEEVGLAHEDVDIVGRLFPLRTASSGRWIVPYVALAKNRPPVWAASPVEVEEVLHVPLAHLVTPGVFWEERWDFGGTSWPISFFDLGPDVIWGATAAMLRDLLARLLGVPVEPRQDSPLWLPPSETQRQPSTRPRTDPSPQSGRL